MRIIPTFNGFLSQIVNRILDPDRNPDPESISYPDNFKNVMH